MVTTFGNSIFGACTGDRPVKAIYAYGEKVWPSELVPGEYYIKWSPADLSGSFTIGGETRWLQDYSGYYSGPFLSKSVNLPSGGFSTVYLIDASAFRSTGIIAVETNLEFISQRAFMDCSSLVYVSMPNILMTNGGIFRSCTKLGYVELPALQALSQDTFNSCTNLYEVSLPNCRWIGTDAPAFRSCYNLQSLYLPVCSALDDYALAWTGLSILELPVCSTVGPSVVYSCSSLHTLILGYDGVVPGAGALTQGTQITSSTGSIYVPLSWVSEYKSATGWSQFADIIQPIPHP